MTEELLLCCSSVVGWSQPVCLTGVVGLVVTPLTLTDRLGMKDFLALLVWKCHFYLLTCAEETKHLSLSKSDWSSSFHSEILSCRLLIPSSNIFLSPQDAICTLNTLQTNASALEQVRRERSNPQLQLNAMRGFLERAGLTVSQSGRRKHLELQCHSRYGLQCYLTCVSVCVKGGRTRPSQYHSHDWNKGQGELMCVT